MRIVRALILVLCLALIAIIAVAALHADRLDSRALLSKRVSSILRSRDAPPGYRRCLAIQIESRLTDEEARQAQTEPSEVTRRKLRESGLACARRLVASGNFSAQQVLEMRRRLRPPGF